MNRMLALAAFASICNAQTFEVASIRPIADGPARAGLVKTMQLLQDRMPLGMIPGRGAAVSIHDTTLAGLVAMAYKLPTSEVVGPTWVFETSYNVEANAPANASRGDLNGMLKALLSDRFGLAVHFEDREVNGFALSAGKGPLKITASAPPESDPDHNRIPELPAPRFGQRGGLSEYQGITLPVFALQLSHLAKAPVVDETGLSGRYDIALDTYAAVDRGEPISIAAAVQNLGLKLNPRKVSVKLLVIDRANKVPTPN